MRIISGKYRGRIIHPPKTLRARPTTDVAKEGLFNILNNHFDFDGLEVLDLFSGTGSISFEFVSRGARRVTMVETNFQHTQFIQKSILTLGIDNAKILRADFFKIIHRLEGYYDIIFADPPYDLEEFSRVPKLVLSAGLLKPGGWFILEHSGKYDFRDLEGFFEVRKYGSVNFSFFKVS